MWRDLNTVHLLIWDLASILRASWTAMIAASAVSGIVLVLHLVGFCRSVSPLSSVSLPLVRSRLSSVGDVVSGWASALSSLSNRSVRVS